MGDPLKTDLKLVFRPTGEVDLAVGAVDLELVSERDNLVQALSLRLLVPRGELEALGHPRYGTRVHSLIGEPMDRENLGLLRRYVRRTLLDDPRVEDIVQLSVVPRSAQPGIVDVTATVQPIEGEPVQVGVAIDVG